MDSAQNSSIARRTMVLPDLNKVKSDLQDHKLQYEKIEQDLKSVQLESEGLEWNKHILTSSVKNKLKTITQQEDFQIDIQRKIEDLLLNQNKATLAASCSSEKIKKNMKQFEEQVKLLNTKEICFTEIKDKIVAMEKEKSVLLKEIEENRRRMQVCSKELENLWI